MAKQTILWTVLPAGWAPQDGAYAGQALVSVVVSPRLTPQTSGEQVLQAFPEFLDWPDTVSGATFKLVLAAGSLPLTRLSKPNSELWKKLFKAETPVAGFQFKDMSKVNMHSYAVRNVLSYVRKHYSRLAVQSASNHPTLLPWNNAHPDLKGMLSDIGTRTIKQDFGDRTIEFALPGFSRFFDEGGESLRGRLGKSVFGPRSVYKMPVSAIGAEEHGPPPQKGSVPKRALPSDWYNPRPNGPQTPLVNQPDAVLMDQFSSAAEYAFYQANRFYNREPATDEERRMRYPSYQNIAAPPDVPEYDFHRIVASFGDYGALLRALGLVIDFVVEDSSVLHGLVAAGGGTAEGSMRLDAGWSSGHDASTDNRPKTAWRADEDRFYTRPRGNELDRGLLRLEGTDDDWGQDAKDEGGLFDIYQLDPDGATLKTVGFTLSAQNLVAKSLDPTRIDGAVTYTTGDRQAVAALRSGGIGISQHGRAGQVAQDAAAAVLKNKAVDSGKGDKVTFFAEDLLRGYRVDVSPVDDWTSVGPWHTLCARDGQYRIIETDEMLEFPADEGHISGASTTSTASDTVNPDDHYMHESLFRWTGWSLCASRPGKTIRAEPVEDTQLQGEVPADIADQAEKGNGLAVQFKATKGSLPRLRFGQFYRFRARVVDIASNSLALDDPKLDPLEQASDAVGYWRFEPIDPPAVVQRSRLSEGESLERLVIRSNYSEDTSSYLNTPDFVAAAAKPESKDFEYVALAERHFVAPKSSQQQCETHGQFDPYFADWQSIKKGYEIAAREDGTLYDQAPGAQVELVTPTVLSNVASTKTIPPELPSAENPVGDRLSGGQYIVHREEQIRLPYLPDPAAAGIAIRAQAGEELPGVIGTMVFGPSCEVKEAPNKQLVILVTNGGAWPDTQGFRLILAERRTNLTERPCLESFPDAGLPKWSEADRTLTLFLPKGRIARLAYASFADSQLIKNFGLPQWTSSEGESDFIIEMAKHGSHWMLTPFRNMTLVHATQQPICLPELIKLAVARGVGAQHVDLHCRLVRLHGPSTGKFEIDADWHEWVDDINKPGPERVHRKGQLGEILLDENHRNEFVLSQAVRAQIVDPTRPRAPADRHELGDTKFRAIRYRIRATTRFREYLPPSLYDQSDLVTRLGPIAVGQALNLGGEDDAGTPVLKDPSAGEEQTLVPASAPPDDPRILYVIPTFGWERSQSGKTTHVTRHGNGLRVWLDRPWFTSGDGEMLGVVLFGENARFTDVPAHMQALVTQWGLDPLWDTTLPKSRTRAGDFPTRIQSEAMPLQERPDDPPVQIVGHRVHWDVDRRLWYCDIELSPGTTYMPFIRLALVRYQPHALPGHKISKVALAEFSQVLPLRRTTLTRSDNKVSVKLHGTVPHFGSMKYDRDSPYLGLSFTNGPHDTGRNRVELVVQTRDPQLDSDLAWEDFKILRSAVIGGSSGGIVIRPGIVPGGLFAEPASTAETGRTVESRAGNIESLPDAQRRRVPPRGGIRPAPRNPPIWSTSITLPDTGGKPARLMLREFERYYTDRTVPELRAGAVRQRRYVEERLVCAKIFEL